MKRIYIPHMDKEDLLEIKESSQLHYLKNVIRIKSGDVFLGFNESEGEWMMKCVHVSKKEIIARKQSQTKIHTQRSFLGLAFGLIKHQSLSWMVEKATELGVSDLFPLVTDNTQYATIKSEKLKLTIIDAVQQSERIDNPTLHEPSRLSEFIKEQKKRKLYIACEREKAELTIVTIPYKRGEPTIYIIGPEGGWSKEELRMFQHHYRYTMGENILRSETAAISSLAIHNAKGDWENIQRENRGSTHEKNAQ